MYREILTLPPCSVINSYGDGLPPALSKKDKVFKNALLRTAYAAIAEHQRRKYPDSQRVDAVHTVAKIYDNYVLDVTFPVASVHPATLRSERKFRCYKWVGSDLVESLLKSNIGELNALGNEVRSEMYHAALKLHGHGYDWFQLVGIGWQKIFAGILMKYLPQPYRGLGANIGEILSLKTLFGLGKLRTVCSAGSHAVILAAYKTLQKNSELLIAHDLKVPPRPLGDQWVEVTCPADFENHPSFVEVALTV